MEATTTTLCNVQGHTVLLKVNVSALRYNDDNNNLKNIIIIIRTFPECFAPENFNAK